MPQSHSSGQTRSIGESTEVSKASGLQMGTLHGLTLQLFNYTGDREVLKKFEDAQEAWFEGEFSYTEAQSYYYLLTAKLNQYRGEGYVS